MYEQNLNLTLNSLAVNASKTGFYITTIGQSPDTVYGLIQCQGYISNVDCQTCAGTAADEITQLCQNKKEAFIGYITCSLHYSDSRFFSTANSIPRYALCNVQNTSNRALFDRQLGSLLKNLSNSAADSPSRYAAGGIAHTAFVDIYAMQRCTGDLGIDDCFSCLEYIISYIPQTCNGSVGGQIFSMSCSLRYEIYSFTPWSSPPPPAQTASPPSLLQPNSTPSATTNSKDDGTKSTSRTIAVVVTPIAVALVLIPIICGFFIGKKAKRKGNAGPEEYDNRSMESLLIGLDRFRVATGNFSDEYKLGEGGFGPVYKGKLPDGREIAVKRLSSSSGQGLEELKTEVMLVARLLHRNLVRLLGFCLEEEEKLLVYEYLPNGSLDKSLFDPRKRLYLEWEQRYKIIVGIARGLLYLHEDSQLRIIHRDLKASNILLDESMNPKISDFGLARLFSGSQTQAKTNRISGTCGYMALEYAKKGHFSPKSDVYSFGVLVLEIVTGRKSSSFRNFMNLQSYAWQHWVNGTALELLDPTLGDQWPRYEVLKCIHIGLLCVQEHAADRPTMSEIVMMLSSYAVTFASPLRPAFFVPVEGFESVLAAKNYGGAQRDGSVSESLQQSVNEVSITELDPR
ncbi:putative receptor-like protein kinase At4g00960 isoform X2 [Tripterygium wilfordii]|nr:putative receptor-like protein kinase At4g00960 isoform X2 [Tripterygium wilfordii]